MKKPRPFNDLQMQDKSVLINDFATPICSIEYYDHRVYLYALNSLFIEAYHNIETRQIERITKAEYGDLDKYLSRITLSKLTPNKKRKETSD